MNWLSDTQLSRAALFWPALVTASATETASRFTAQLLALAAEADAGPSPEPAGATANTVALDLRTVRLRDYGGDSQGTPALVCAPLALHGAMVADLAPGHSLVSALRTAGIGRLMMADWRSASADMAFLGIDDYLATLNVLVDHMGGAVDLIGLCQGGVLSLIYAARFPGKVRRLVVAGAPINPFARPSDLSTLAAETPLATFQGLVSTGGGRVIGRTVAGYWGAAGLETSEVCKALQLSAVDDARDFVRLRAAFDAWNAWTLDLPGTYYLEIIDRLYKRNELAKGRFVALGETVDLSRMHVPIYCLAAEGDRVVAPEQVMAVARLVGTGAACVRTAVVPGGHLSLFMGRETLAGAWPEIVRWVRGPEILAPSG